MSWDSHISAMQTSGADDCCISDQNGNIWAKSAGLNKVTQQELITIIKAAKGQDGDGEKIELNGIPLMKVRVLEGNITVCNLVTKQSDKDKELCCAALSGKAVVIVKKGGPNQRNAVEICEKEVQYLNDSGY